MRRVHTKGATIGGRASVNPCVHSNDDDLVVSVEILDDVRDRYDAERADPDGSDG
jgi:hypothetical protein